MTDKDRNVLSESEKNAEDKLHRLISYVKTHRKSVQDVEALLKSKKDAGVELFSEKTLKEIEEYDNMVLQERKTKTDVCEQRENVDSDKAYSLVDAIRLHLNEMTEDEQKIVSAYFGFNGVPKKTHSELAEEWHVSKECIYVVVVAASLKVLRVTCTLRSKKLRDFLD